MIESNLSVDALVVILKIMRFSLYHKCYTILLPLLLSHLECYFVKISKAFSSVYNYSGAVKGLSQLFEKYQRED